MRIDRLTKKLCSEWTPEKPGDPFLWDESRPGLGLRVSPTGKRSFCLQYWNKESGKQRRLSLGKVQHLGLKEAWARAAEILVTVRAGADPAEEARAARRGHNSAPLVKDLASEYQRRHSELKKIPKSAREDAGRWRRHVLPKLGQKLVREVTPSDIADLHAALVTTPTSANRTLALLSHAFNLSIRWGWRPLGSNPALGIERYKEKRRQKIFEREQVQAILEYVARVAPEAEHSEALQLWAIRLLVYTGMRPSEVFRLRWEWVDFTNRLLDLPKAKGDRALEVGRRVGLAPQAVATLEQLRTLADDSPWVFPSVRGDGHMTTARRVWATLKDQLGLEGDLYAIRHSYATFGEQAGVPLGEMRDALGHGDVRTTERYRHGAQVEDLRMTANRMASYFDGGQAQEVEPPDTTTREIFKCACPREILVAASLAQAGAITCGVCREEFSC